MLPGITPVLIPLKEPVFSSIGWNASSVNAATYTYTAQDIGTPADDRLVIVVTEAHDDSNGSPVVSSLTVGGIAATQAIARTLASRDHSIWYARVPTGSAADIVINLSTTCERSAIAVFTLVGHTNDTPFDTALLSSANPMSTSALTLPPNGAAVACGSVIASTSFSSSDFTETLDAVVEGTTFYAGYRVNNSGAETPTLNVTAASGTPIGCCASWR
jgi:hypothetical protein